MSCRQSFCFKRMRSLSSSTDAQHVICPGQCMHQACQPRWLGPFVPSLRWRATNTRLHKRSWQVWPDCGACRCRDARAVRAHSVLRRVRGASCIARRATRPAESGRCHGEAADAKVRLQPTSCRRTQRAAATADSRDESLLCWDLLQAAGSGGGTVSVATQSGCRARALL